MPQVTYDDIMQVLISEFGAADWLLSEYEASTKLFVEADLADKHFLSCLSSNDNQIAMLWELILGCHFIKLGYNVERTDHGPDFLVEKDGLRVWVECHAPKPSDALNDWVNDPNGFVPVDQIRLRWTNGFFEKARQFNKFRARGIVRKGDICTIAINGFLLGDPFGSGESGFPYAAETVYPFGPIGFRFSRDGKLLGQFRESTDKLIKENLEPINPNFFCVDDYKDVTGLLGSVTLKPSELFDRMYWVPNRISAKSLAPAWAGTRLYLESKKFGREWKHRMSSTDGK